MLYVKGQKVQTVLGPGTVVGFETFDLKGFFCPLKEEDPGGNSRVVVALDNPENWLGHGKLPTCPHPYFFRSDLTELKEQP